MTRPRKYSELTPTEAIQADCDVKATNIILRGLSPEVYELERECKLYNEFDKFAYKKGETLRDFYLKFSLLLNDMNIYNVKLEQFQVNIKFLNTLPPEWSKFVTDVKLVRNSLNPGQQATIHDERVALQPVHGRQISLATSTTRTYTPGANQLKTQVINCTKINLNNKSVNDTLTGELERYKEQVKVLKEGQNANLKSRDSISDSCEQSFEIDRFKQTLSEQLKERESLMQTVALLKNNFKKEESKNIDREIALKKKIKQLDNIVYKRDQSGQTVHMLTKP
nr:hypothetical protein [Tanacetum cinerariifolium]